MDWWIWALAGFALLLVELLTPGSLFFVFFGAAGIVVSVITALGVEAKPIQFFVFSVLSVASLLWFRKPLQQRLETRSRSSGPVDSLAGESVVLTEDLSANGLGQAELRGTVWKVQNGTATPLHKGQRCRVERVDGLKLVVTPE